MLSLSNSLRWRDKNHGHGILTCPQGKHFLMCVIGKGIFYSFWEAIGTIGNGNFGNKLQILGILHDFDRISIGMGSIISPKGGLEKKLWHIHMGLARWVALEV